MLFNTHPGRYLRTSVYCIGTVKSSPAPTWDRATANRCGSTSLAFFPASFSPLRRYVEHLIKKEPLIVTLISLCFTNQTCSVFSLIINLQKKESWGWKVWSVYPANRIHGFELLNVLTKDPANSHNFKECQEHEGNHSSVVVHQLKYIDSSLCRKQKRPIEEKTETTKQLL